MRRMVLWIVMILTAGAAAGFTWRLPELNVPQMSIIYDINGREVKGIYQENRISVGLDQVSPYLVDAFIAVEDKNFYRHHGIDLGGVLRAALVNLREMRVVEGGSTITQQTAKNLFLTQERTLTRKIKELYYTFLLEKQYTKDEILQMYLNTIYFGNGAYGVEAAARTYFAKSASKLDLAESALLAGIPARPSRFNPLTDPEAAKSRQAVVLERMVEEGKITEEEARKASKQLLHYKKARFIKGDAPYFADMVIDYLVKKYGARMVYQGGLKIYTGLDLDMQEAAQEAYDEMMRDKDRDLQAALVAVDARNGYIKAMIGGRDFSQSQFNRAINAYRQPGSAFKPFLYSLAIEEGYTAASTFTCDWVEFPQPDGTVYRPTDYGDEPYHYRTFTLKEAIMVSDNVVSVKLNNSIGPAKFAGWAQRFGFKHRIRPVLSLALGTSEVSPLEMASALTAFASGGVKSEPVAIIRVLDRNGKVLEEHRPQRSRLLSPENAYIVTDMLSGVLEPGGTASHLKSLVVRPAAGKTGTTQEYRDAWFVGYTPQLSCAVWVGYDTPTRTVNMPGGRVAGPIWANFIRKASEKLPVENFPRPDDIIEVKVCADTGLVASESCPRTIKAAFIKGTEPGEMCYVHQYWWEDFFASYY